MEVFFCLDANIWCFLSMALLVSPVLQRPSCIQWDTFHDVYSVLAAPYFFEGVVFKRGNKLLIMMTKKM